MQINSDQTAINSVTLSWKYKAACRLLSLLLLLLLLLLYVFYVALFLGNLAVDTTA